MPPDRTVLVTCMGSPIASELIEAVRGGDPRTRVVAADTRPDAIGRLFADDFVALPPGHAPDYCDALFAAATARSVRFVLPCSDEEALAIARDRARFVAAGIDCSVQRADLVEALSSKSAMYRRLAGAGIPVPTHERVESAAEFRRAAERLGYPGRGFVVKPDAARGGRGVWRISAARRRSEVMVGALNVDSIGLDDFLGAFEGEAFPALIAMEELGGDIFDVDVLARGGRCLRLVPRRRVHPRTNPFRGCRVERHEGVLDLSRRIFEALRNDYLIDYDVMLDGEGRPHLLEVNPRISASTVATTRAGLNLVRAVVELSFGLEPSLGDPPWGRLVLPQTVTFAMP